MAIVNTTTSSGVVVGVDPAFNAIIPQMLNYAELRIQRDLDLLPSQTSNSSYTLTAGNNLLTVSVNDFVTIQTLGVTAGGVTTQFSNVVVVGVNSGVILPSTAPIGSRVTVLNATATTLNVYPFVGSQIGGLAVNAAAALAGSTSANYMLVSATVWQIA